MSGIQPISSLLTDWANGGQGRQAWAMNAYQVFLDSLNPRTSQSLPQAQDETRVVLFGLTQVGKTTLLLNLLGIAEEHETKVADLLRGGRKEARSATATAMIYEYSESTSWQLNGRSLNESELTTALKQIRRTVENGGGSFVPERLGIPRHYFDPESRKTLRVQLLDLPGFDPENENENEGAHVSELVKQNVPAADLVLWLASGHELTKLNPHELRTRGVTALDWTSAPGRFCLVTSYTFTTASNKDEFLAKPHDLKAMRTYLADQMNVSGMSIKDPTILYPLEFGKSWKKEKEMRSDLYNATERLLAEAWCALKDRINQTATPLGKLRHAQNVIHFVEEDSQNRLKECDDKLLDLIKALKTAKDEIKAKWGRSRDEAKEYLDLLPGDKEIVAAEEYLRSRISVAVKDAPLPPTDTDRKYTTKWFLSAIDEERERLLGFSALFKIMEEATIAEIPPATDELLELMKASVDTGRISYIFRQNISAGTGVKRLTRDGARTILDGVFGRLEKHLKDYFIASYSRDSENFLRDQVEFDKRMAEARNEIERCFLLALVSSQQTYKKNIDTERKHRQRRLMRREKILEERESEKRNLETNIRALNQNKAAIGREAGEDKARANQFDTMLRTALAIDLHGRRNEIVTETAPVRRFFKLLEAVKVCEMKTNLVRSTNPQRQHDE